MRLLLLIWMRLHPTVIDKVALLVLVQRSLLIILGLVGIARMHLISITPIIHETPIIALVLIILGRATALEAT